MWILQNKLSKNRFSILLFPHLHGRVPLQLADFGSFGTWHGRATPWHGRVRYAVSFYH